MKFLKKLVLVLALFGALGVAGVGCEDNNIEDAGDEIGDTIENAGDEAEDAIN